MNVQRDIRRALEKQYAAVTPALLTAFDNLDFVPPAANVPYAEAWLKRGKPRNPDQGPSRYEVGTWQINLMYPTGTLAFPAEAQAERIADAFPKALSLVENDITVIITDHTFVGSGARVDDRWQVPVLVYWQAEV